MNYDFGNYITNILQIKTESIKTKIKDFIYKECHVKNKSMRCYF